MLRYLSESSLYQTIEVYRTGFSGFSSGQVNTGNAGLLRKQTWHILQPAPRRQMKKEERDRGSGQIKRTNS
ncbi:UNVERIFIED_ORG: hypothetical protein B5F06_12090 [Lacrimispora saccharolytica]|nr:hypothetical protein CLOM621_08139 [Clostridium sp. M62/1]RHT57576.1 hypothetical protein DW757_06580 [Clostridium sp. AM29-11AC]